MRNSWSVATAAILVAVTLAACGAAGGAAGGGHGTGAPAVGAMVPDFRLTGLDGRVHSLSEYRGHVVLINFWATWCVPCRAEIAELESTYRKRHADGVVFLGVDWKEGRDTVEPFAVDRQVTYPVLLDSEGGAYSAYQVIALPQTFVIDRQGRLVVSRSGLATREKFEQELKAAGA
ncbi:MAG: hypothetical protein NVSMB17_08970 [Candidatus Dormibacteria bacterium]